MSTDTARVVRIGTGRHTHIANADGNTDCGSQGARRGGARRKSSTSFLPAGTPVTCSKCDPAAASAPVVVETPAPASADCPTCGHRIPRSNHGVCLICG